MRSTKSEDDGHQRFRASISNPSRPHEEARTSPGRGFWDGLLAFLLGSELFEDLRRLREATGVVLGEEQLSIAIPIAIHNHIEDPVAALDQGRLDAGRLCNFGRQTGGLGKVVSMCAVRDFNLHLRSRVAIQWNGVRRIDVQRPAATCRGLCHSE